MIDEGFTIFRFELNLLVTVNGSGGFSLYTCEPGTLLTVSFICCLSLLMFN